MSMVGLDLIAPLISTIALALLVLMVQHALTELEVFIADVLQERPVSHKIKLHSGHFG